MDRVDPGDFSDEAEYVRTVARATTWRYLMVGAFTIVPFSVIPVWFFWNRIDQHQARLWVALAIMTSGFTLWMGLRFSRGNQPNVHSPENWALHVAAVLIGAHWGLAVFLPSGSDIPLVMTVVLFPFGASAFNIVQCSGVKSLFYSYQSACVTVASVGLITANTRETISVGVVGLLWFPVTVGFYGIIHASTIESLQFRWRAGHLLDELESERSQLALANDQLAHQAVHDSLTGLRNRRGTMEVLAHALDHARATHGRVGVLYMDLDRFKHVNDSLGHRAGDFLLRTVADRLERLANDTDTVGRIGGDEMVLIRPDFDTLDELVELGQRIIRSVTDPLHLDGHEIATSISVGIALGPVAGDSPESLLRNANAALHRAKDRGRARVELFDDNMRSDMIAKFDDERTLRRAIDEGEIMPFFQPEIDAVSGRVVGAEVLARWIRRDGRVASAGELLSMAQDATIIERLSLSVVSQARPIMRRMVAMGLPPGFRFRINLPQRTTPRAWRDDRMEALAGGMDPHLITFDVCEAAVFTDLSQAAARLAAMRTAGMRICLEDAGRGVGSLSLLRSLPLDEIRIDRLTIDSLESHPYDRALVRSVIGLAQELGLAVTADGVETGAQADVLMALGCTRHQGHLHAPAMPGDALESFMHEVAARAEQVPDNFT